MHKIEGQQTTDNGQQMMLTVDAGNAFFSNRLIPI